MAERRKALARRERVAVVRAGAPRAVRGKGEHARELDRLIHERTRLAILSVLAVNDALSFSDLKRLLGLSDGNLSVHARKLEEAGYVECAKSFSGRLPHTEYMLTGPGRRALQGYLDHMEALIRAVKKV